MSDRVLKILLEVGNRIPPPMYETPGDAAIRAQLTREIAEIHAKGGTIDVPGELP